MTETSTTTKTTRPASHDDLANHQREGHLVAVIPSDYITRHPSLGQHLLAALAEADRLGLVVDANGSIRIPKSTEELDAALASAQRNWDTTVSWHAAALEDPTSVESWKRNSVDQFCVAESLAAITWPEVSA